jgi:hypothetical protein
MHELAPSPGVHTCHNLYCMNLVPVLLQQADMAQHLVQPTSPSHHSHIQVLITLGGLGMVTG